LGGTFDPVHNAHLAMAGAALDQLKLDKVLWMPTGNPGYRNPPLASGEHRVAMLRLALEGEPRYEIDPRELSPGASGFTVDTLHELRLELGPDASLVLLMGADQFAKLGSWHRPDEVARLARIAVFARPGFEVNQEQILRVAIKPMPISGSEIRERAARGEDLSALVPVPVASYIARHGLYR
jgi:nicotinate-nucleotide adenylyltransferase